MKFIKELNHAKEIINENELVFVYIGQENCSVCHGLKPQIKQIMNQFEGVTQIELDALRTPEVAEAFQVLTVPVLLLFVEGHEYLRKARIVNTREFKQDIEKIILGYQGMKK
ncbi:thioredoxin family protein [Vagococcus coleopterorum]|uniref:Thioredoxin family protein n=1 Tax=Vagococcus coleopterorum TaxID=2714946 RepID=A0A6G8AP52_9ENTE|nr:thioredoxin family protein [Vagococcus coleopterorum]QIL46722.1 thioredoxin family protein [Vagococcus coleopterorum]